MRLSIGRQHQFCPGGYGGHRRRRWLLGLLIGDCLSGVSILRVVGRRLTGRDRLARASDRYRLCAAQWPSARQMLHAEQNNCLL